MNWKKLTSSAIRCEIIPESEFKSELEHKKKLTTKKRHDSIGKILAEEIREDG